MKIMKLIYRLTASAILVSSPLAVSDVIFEENFDSTSDFTSTMHSTKSGQDASKGSILPEGWTHLYQGTLWSPETGYPENHASLEILAKNAEKAKGGTGKSAVNWRESYTPESGWKMWNSDSQLIKVFDQNYDELYIEFYVRFSPDWWNRDRASGFTSKLFRVGHWSREGTVFSGYRGNLGPLAFWDYKRDSYGVRSVVAYRGGPPQTDNYYFPKDLMPRGDSRNFTSSIQGQEVGGTDPKLMDQVKGGLLVNKTGEVIDHNQVYGPDDTWTKVAFYVKMNSAPGVTDGIFRVFMNNHRIQNKTNIPWVMPNDENRMVGWNYFAIGGNDYFQPKPNEERFEDWYAIDDVTVMSQMPSITISTPPKPPSGLSVK